MTETTPCPRAWDLLPLRDALLRHPSLTAAERCTALHALKQALCPCPAICDRWARLMVDESRRMGEAIPPGPEP
jgi:hypothetical protein